MAHDHVADNISKAQLPSREEAGRTEMRIESSHYGRFFFGPSVDESSGDHVQPAVDLGSRFQSVPLI